MINIISIPRINALGLNGPEKAPEILLKKIPHEKINVGNEDISEDEKLIRKEVKKHVESSEKTLFVGGDHSITYPIGLDFMKKYRDKSFLIVFDAHPDCMPSMKEPTHEDYLAGLIKRGWNPKNICLIGIRKIEPEEKRFLEKFKMKYFSQENSIKEIKKYLEKNTNQKQIYLSVDIDAVDPKNAMAVNYPEQKGISKHNLFNLLKYILPKSHIIDIVEFVPQKDVKKKTERFVKKIIKLINKK